MVDQLARNTTKLVSPFWVSESVVMAFRRSCKFLNEK
jgi:hypothetical protein